MIERKIDEFKDDLKKWNIYSDLGKEHLKQDMSLEVKFLINRKEVRYLTEKDLETLKQDLKDLGKFRIIEQRRKFLK